ncbi:hypothetical protein AYI68_g7128, partial [Smittium mucronatum]
MVHSSDSRVLLVSAPVQFTKVRAHRSGEGGRTQQWWQVRSGAGSSHA